jgi:hypothetical protein
MDEGRRILKKKIILILNMATVLLLLSACQHSTPVPTQINVAEILDAVNKMVTVQIAQTLTAQAAQFTPTRTPRPTETPTISPTPTLTVQSAQFTSTSTPRPTETPTIVLTATESFPPSIISTTIPDTPETRAIIDTIEKARVVEYEAVYDFYLTDLPTVFINDPRFNMSPATLEVVRELTNNLSLSSAGLLDYKMAFDTWRRDSILHRESLMATARAENRDLTDEERASLIDKYGRIAPAREPILSSNEMPLDFESINIQEDVAVADVSIDVNEIEWTLVFVNNQWYLAKEKILSSGF